MARKIRKSIRGKGKTVSRRRNRTVRRHPKIRGGNSFTINASAFKNKGNNFYKDNHQIRINFSNSKNGIYYYDVYGYSTDENGDEDYHIISDTFGTENQITIGEYYVKKDDDDAIKFTHISSRFS